VKEFHEALNFAAIHHLSVVFYCENNGYAISEKSDKQMPLRRVADRARGYDIHGVSFDGNDLAEVYQTSYWAIEECRRGHGPQLLEAVTYRYGPHTTADDTRYRPRAEVEEWSRRDPIDRYRQVLVGAGTWSDEQENALREEARAELDLAVDEAAAAPDPTVAQAMRHVFYEG
jgi:TPP-dependent pyruvate/acetoin dehydrogenase alpha subunit